MIHHGNFTFSKTLLVVAFLFRFAGWAFLLSITHDAISLSTNREASFFCLLLGHGLGTLLAFTRIRWFIAPIAFSAFYFFLQLIFQLAEISSSNSAIAILKPYSLYLDANLLLAIFVFGYGTTWGYWRSRQFASVEMLAVLTGLMLFLSSHRDFQLASAPKVVHSIAWSINISTFTLIITFGALTSLLSFIYLAIAGHAGRPAANDSPTRGLLEVGERRPIYGAAFVVSLLFIIVLVGQGIHGYYRKLQDSLGANGVGRSEADESVGKSPLGFHSALGSNNQPAAMVRLETDYAENPTSPMLYLREAALSKIEGFELVSAGRGFDDDIPGTKIDKPFRTEEKLHYLYRVPIQQSIYLLTDHDVVFALDYPLSIDPLQNPAPKRFRGAYRTYSVAPSYKTEELAAAKTGDPSWSPEKLAHYLQPHTDARYSSLATTIVEDETNHALQAQRLVQYLNKKAIYTLTPKHEVGKGEDPVAPFLFGDMRGYCVHFAHATVFMLRSLKIPARIATGYLTDLSQSRDGHILLRMSDRHAWAEAYFEGFGWVPFDTQPEQVESHADTEVDAQLLEELMGLVGDEQLLLLSSEESLDEPGLDHDEYPNLPITRIFLFLLLCVLGLLYVRKFVLWYSWVLPLHPEWRLGSAHNAIFARLLDLGFRRELGETRSEFLQRITRDAGVYPRSAWKVFHHYKYAGKRSDHSELQVALSHDLAEFKKIPLLKRLVALVSLRSIFYVS